MRTALLMLASAACARAPMQGALLRRPPRSAPYMMLFERGRVFTLPVKGGPAATCTVTEVKEVGDANVAHLGCASPYEAALIAGTWVATPAGLYHPYIPVDDPDELALLSDDDLLIAAVPAEREHTHVVDQAHESIETFSDRGSWCVRHTTTAGTDRRRYAICFDGSTVTGAVDDVRSGSASQRIDFGTVPPNDDDDGDRADE